MILCIGTLQIEVVPQPATVGEQLVIGCIALDQSLSSSVQLRFSDGSTDTQRGFQRVTDGSLILFIMPAASVDLDGLTVQCVLAEVSSDEVTLQVLFPPAVTSVGEFKVHYNAVT